MTAPVEIAARAFWVTAPGQGEIRSERLRPPGPGEVQVRAIYSAISRGTEALVFRGEVPASERARMRAPYQGGEFPAPVKYGYSSVGVVEGGASEHCGRTVFCLYPHQTRYVVPVDAVLPLPEAVPAARAVLAANLETAVNALWDAPVLPGDRVAVVGAGVVGCLVAWLAGRVPGCRVELIDVDPARAPVAAALGVGFAPPCRAAGEVDLVFHASGNPAGLATALGLAGFEAHVVELSWYGDRLAALPLGEAFHARRLALVSSQVGHVAPARRARRTRRERLGLALELLRDDRLDTLLGAETPFEELPRLMARLAGLSPGALCERVRYPETGA
jgi:threonine dehydrogenase-like Zn-dependent dehydrogenase